MGTCFYIQCRGILAPIAIMLLHICKKTGKFALKNNKLNANLGIYPIASLSYG